MLRGSSLSLSDSLLEASSTYMMCASSEQPSGGGTGSGLLLVRGIGRIEGEERGEKKFII